VHTRRLAGLQRPLKAGYVHRARSERAEPGEHLLSGARRAVSNLKGLDGRTHRGVGDAHLQVYLDEYVFRRNRRRTPMAAFQTLLGLSALCAPTTFDQVIRCDQTA